MLHMNSKLKTVRSVIFYHVLVSGLTVSQTCHAYVAWLNMWDYEMSLEEINSLTCESEGNILTQTDMLLYGGAEFTYTDSFQCGKIVDVFSCPCKCFDGFSTGLAISN